MSTWETITWDIARAGGLTAYVLLALSVTIGLALSLHLQSPRWPRIINSELHNFGTLLATIFTGVHVLAVAVDPFTHFGLNELLIPLASHYRPLWMAFGIVGLYLGIAIGISTWLRPKIGYALWRRLHVLTLVLYGLVTVHGIASGSDAGTWWADVIYLGSVAVVGTLLMIRLLAPHETPSGASQHPHPAQPAGAHPVVRPPAPGTQQLVTTGHLPYPYASQAVATPSQPSQLGPGQTPVASRLRQPMASAQAAGFGARTPR
jgi:predicted ferric reductase